MALTQIGKEGITGISNSANANAITIDSGENVALSGTLGVTGETTLATHLNMGDNDKIKFGDGADLEIYHSGTASIIADTGTGNLVLRADGFYLNNAAGSENMIHAAQDGAVTLYHNNAAKLATSSTGATLTGNLTVTDGHVSSGVTHTYNLFGATGTGGSASYVTYSFVGDPNTGMYSGTADTVKFATGGSERMRIHSSGRVGIGTSGNTIQGSLVIKDTVDHNGSDVFVVAQNGNASRQAGYKVFDEGGTSSLEMKYDNGSNFARISNPNNGQLSINLGGTGSANMLDDYEEGTWTPTADGGSTTYHDQYGFYTKIGRLVYAKFNIRINNYAGSVGYVLGNLPFTSMNVTGSGGSGTIFYWGNLANNATFIGARVDANVSAIYISASFSASTSMGNINHNWAGNNAQLIGHVLYHTA